MSRGSVRFAGVVCAAAALTICGSAIAEEVVVKNDSVVDGSDAAIQAGFVAGESAAAWLTSPCSGNIVAVQVYWASVFGGAPQSIEDSITVFEQGAFPEPGPVMQNGIAPFQDVIFEAPVMTDGFLNEFRYLDEGQTVEISVPIAQNEVFIVSFRFAETPGPFGPSVVTDTDGCQSGKNAIDASPGGWTGDFCDKISGDFFIRAVVDCQVSAGACCQLDGSCDNGVLAEDCDGLYQDFFDGQTCAEVTCLPPRGACCSETGQCQDAQQEGFCESFGGIYAGDGALCTSGVCAGVGACCEFDGACNLDVASECTAAGGDFQGGGTDCDPNPCPEPTGACCSGGGCLENQTQAFCEDSLLATYAGHGTECADDVCVPGSCCLPDGSCQDVIEVDCTGLGGTFNGPGTDCNTTTCPQPRGACCVNQSCVADQFETNCKGFPGGEWAGPFTTCFADLCPICDDGDADQDGDWDVDDFRQFQICYNGSAAGPCKCLDMDNNNLVDWNDYQSLYPLLDTGGPQ